MDFTGRSYRLIHVIPNSDRPYLSGKKASKDKNGARNGGYPMLQGISSNTWKPVIRAPDFHFDLFPVIDIVHERWEWVLDTDFCLVENLDFVHSSFFCE